MGIDIAWKTILDSLPPEALVVMDRLMDLDWPLFRESPLEICHPNPFARHEWKGKVVSLDEASSDDIDENSLVFCLLSGRTKGYWDGESAGIALIKDGRWVAWETWWGPTGDGFNHDAYGGSEVIYVATHPEVLRTRGLGENGRHLCGLTLPSDKPPSFIS